MFGLKKCSSKVQIYFKNPTTYEYIFFKLNIYITDPPVLGDIELCSTVRETCTKILLIENPLPNPVTIKKDMISSNDENISI